MNRPIRCALVALTFAACSCEPDSPPVTIHAPAELDEAVRWAADDLAAELRLLGASVTTVADPAGECMPGEVHIEVRGQHKLPAPWALDEVPAHDQQIVVRDERCGETGRRVVLRGGGLMSAQWAVYALLEKVGVAFWHPEQTFRPASLVWPDSVATDEVPFFPRRSFHAHRTHPIELSAPLEPGDLDMAGYQRRWVDWNVKLRQTELDGWDFALLGDYAWKRGFPRSAGFTLLGKQQGGDGILDPDDPRSEEQQIADAIDAKMEASEGKPPATRFSVQFNSTEFTEEDDQVTVGRLTFLTNYLTENYPQAQVWTINHGTHGEPTEHYKVRYYDLPQFAPPQLGTSVHLLMFYGLDRAAPVYGNADFSHSERWIREQSAKRRIEYYPESSWWLTFDLPVPLYLAPVTLEARSRDLRILEGLVAESPDSPTGVTSHHTFTSGQEWGYWLIDWCIAKMTWDASMTHKECLRDFTSRLSGGDTIRQVLEEIEARQVVDLRDPNLLSMLVGSDDATEAAAAAGIVFHPLPPAPADVLRWSDEQVQDFRTSTLEPASQMAEAYAAWTKRLDPLVAQQDARQAPWVREVRDGVEIFGLRAAHAVEVYETVFELRDALAAGEPSAVKAAYEGVERARGITDRAREIVRAREQDYRYPPELTIAGGEPGTDEALENDTVYPYRYLHRTHSLFFWTRPDDQLARLFGEGLETVRVPRRILPPGEALDVTLLANEVHRLEVDWGDGQTATELAPHAYDDQGLYAWVLDAQVDDGAVHHEDQAASVARRFVFSKGSLKVVKPSGASLLNGLLPGFVIGSGTDAGGDFLVLGRLDAKDDVESHGSLQRRDANGLASVKGDLSLELAKVGRVTIHGATITVDEGTGADARRLDIRGVMRTDDIVDLLVSVGGFEREGAFKLVAEVLGTTPDEMPAEVEAVVEAKGMETLP